MIQHVLKNVPCSTIEGATEILNTIVPITKAFTECYSDRDQTLSYLSDELGIEMLMTPEKLVDTLFLQLYKYSYQKGDSFQGPFWDGLSSSAKPEDILTVVGEPIFSTPSKEKNRHGTNFQYKLGTKYVFFRFDPQDRFMRIEFSKDTPIPKKNYPVPPS